MSLDENLSFYAIATRMSAKFSVTFTRNSVVGKAHRLRMPPRPLRETLTSHNTHHHANGHTVRKVHDLPLDREPLAPHQKYESNVPLIDLRYGACKWPEGNAVPYTFCGKPAVDHAAPYCASHAEMAYVRARKSWE